MTEPGVGLDSWSRGCYQNLVLEGKKVPCQVDDQFPRRDVVRGGDAGETPTLATMATSMHTPNGKEGASG